MHTDIAQAAVLVGTPGTVQTLVVAGTMTLAGLYALVGLVVTEEINLVIQAVYESDSPVR